jgi:hypothetical protein
VPPSFTRQAEAAREVFVRGEHGEQERAEQDEPRREAHACVVLHRPRASDL